ncbi:ribonuclease H-like protein, partial [Stereum hirsutum FP-91666 SS1]|uniref:ribonuclease H-like protein n=1 Tax=Stereum hirsutum (strain FP-91666) TaxID=721885 RepID=UPI000440DD9B
MSVWTDGSCHGNGRDGARAGAGIWWAANSPRNVSARVPGAQTNMRGELLAVYIALREADPRRTLILYTDNEVVIRTYCYWVEGMLARGWKCANADIIRPTAGLLHARPARVWFRWVKGHSGDVGNDGSDTKANEGA